MIELVTQDECRVQRLQAFMTCGSDPSRQAKGSHLSSPLQTPGEYMSAVYIVSRILAAKDLGKLLTTFSNTFLHERVGDENRMQ